MKKSIFLLGLVISFSQVFSTGNSNLNRCIAGPDSILLRIDGKPVTIAEFERIYKKNNTKDNTIDAKSIEEYLELFINFKLKVTEAEKTGLDTSKSFKTELSGYRKQLAKPYLVDKDIDEGLLKEAYERMQSDVHASHILIKLDPGAAPKDTLEAWNKILKARKRVTDGESFDAVAKEVSEDPSAKDNAGNLGYFTAFQMVYPFESAAFNTKPGEISMPFKTNFGYHILKVHDKRKASGEIKTAHIMVITPKGTSPEDEEKAKKRIFDIHEKLKAGEDFTKVAKENSDDKGTASKGGDLPWFGTGRMVPEFEQAAFALKNNGDISAPVKTSFGWHIIKRIEKRDVGNYEDVKADIKNKISKDERADRSRQAVIAKLKKDYSYKEFTNAPVPVKGKQAKNVKPTEKRNLDDFYTVVTDSIFNGKWSLEEASKLQKNLFSIGDSIYTQQDFSKYLLKYNRKGQKMNITEFVDSKFKEFTDAKIIKYEEDRLENKYPDFRYLMNEYHDGILLFELTDRMVWSKAIKDSVGLKDFYEKNKTKYTWDTRYDLKVFQCKNEKIFKKAFSLFTDEKKKLGAEEIMKSVNKKDTTDMVAGEKGLFLKGDNKIVDAKADLLKDKPVFTGADGNKIIQIKRVDPQPKSLDEAKGLITADYQTFLEDQWIKDLRNKYKVEVFKETLKTIK